MGFILTLVVLVGAPLLFGARSRLSRMERRLGLVEGELRRRIALEAAASGEHPAPAEPAPLEPKPEPEPVAAIPIEAKAPVAAAALAVPVDQVRHEVKPERTPPAEKKPKPPKRHIAINFEELFGRRLPIWAGGITLAIAGVLIVKYAIDAGFFGRIFTPGVQAIAGALFGLALIAGAEWAWRKRDKVEDPRVSQALSGAGISTLYAALLVAASVYHLIPPLAAFIGVAVVTAGALWLSLRHGMPSAILGLVGGLAAPTLTGAVEPNVPLLAAYLAFTIGGLAGVSRIQRWPWLAVLAILGGAGWSLWLILAGEAMTALGALSIGTFVLLLAIAMPLFAFRDAAARLLRAVAAVVGAAQLALLVGMGGYQPLHWGLFALIAAAGQWLAWREAQFRLVPTIGAALSVLLLLLWPEPGPGWLAAIGFALTAIHAGPLLVRMWHSPARLQNAVELAAIAVAIPVIALWHFHAPWGEPDRLGGLSASGGALLVLGAAALGWKAAGREGDSRFALLLATAGALISAAAWLAFPHWQAPIWIAAVSAALLFLSPPSKDWRIEWLAVAFSGLALLALLATIPEHIGELQVLFGVPHEPLAPSSGARWVILAALFTLFATRSSHAPVRLVALSLVVGLLYGLGAQHLPEWTLPVVLAVLAALATVPLRREVPAADGVLFLFAAVTGVLLAITGADPLLEWQRLGGAGDGSLNLFAFARWAAIAAFGALIAARARTSLYREIGQVFAALAAYGALAQVVPLVVLPFVPALAVLGLALSSRKLDLSHLWLAATALAVVSAAWAALPLVYWTDEATRSLWGTPMTLASPELAPLHVLRRLLGPVLLAGGALWLLRKRIAERILPAFVFLTGVLGVIALHALYRAGFAGAFGADFVATGLGQRLLWDGLLVAAAMLLRKRGGGGADLGAAAMVGFAAFHIAVYSLTLHNPLWAEQAVGRFPAANLLVPLFAAVPVCAILLQRIRPMWERGIGRVLQPLLMAMMGLFGWATLRQAFHGALLVDPGVGEVEDILRSILGIVLAIGFLLWGIRQHRRDWRIASLLLVLAAVAKVFLFDASGLEGLLRIASFVALGFSLIGIGWLYSRQLRREAI